MSFGDGDPSIGEAARRAHDAAQRRGSAHYVDPDSGLLVMTAAHLRAAGTCCGNGCRHCPYPAAEQRAAGRPSTRPG